MAKNGCAQQCGSKTVTLAVRACNVGVTLIGLTLIGFSLYMIIRAKTVTSVSGIVLALGLIDTIFGLLIFLHGYKSLGLLRLYAFVVGLLELAQVCIAVLFLVPSTQQKILDTINLPDEEKTFITNNIQTSGWVLLAAVAFQGVTLAFVLSQQCLLDRGFDESEFDQESLLGASAPPSSKKGKKGGDKFGAMDDEVMTNTAASRYKEKASRYYEKYGLK